MKEIVKQPEFKIAPQEPELKETPKKEKKTKSEPAAILEEILKKDTMLDVQIPRQLPTVDFMDEPSNSRQNKFKRNDKKPEVDYANLPVKKFEKPQKKPKNKFSKVSNPYPNDQAKNPTSETNVKQKKVEPKPAAEPIKETEKTKKKTKTEPSSNSGSGNSNVFTADSVDSLKIHPHSIKNMKEVLNFHKLTHVQQKSIPAALEGKDLLIRSPTGELSFS